MHTSPDATFVRRIQGKPFLFLTDMYSSFVQIYRFNPATDGKIAIPAGMFVGTHGEDKQINCREIGRPINQNKENGFGGIETVMVALTKVNMIAAKIIPT